MKISVVQLYLGGANRCPHFHMAIFPKKAVFTLDFLIFDPLFLTPCPHFHPLSPTQVNFSLETNEFTPLKIVIISAHLRRVFSVSQQIVGQGKEIFRKHVSKMSKTGSKPVKILMHFRAYFGTLADNLLALGNSTSKFMDPLKEGSRSEQLFLFQQFRNLFFAEKIIFHHSATVATRSRTPPGKSRVKVGKSQEGLLENRSRSSIMVEYFSPIFSKSIFEKNLYTILLFICTRFFC